MSSEGSSTESTRSRPPPIDTSSIDEGNNTRISLDLIVPSPATPRTSVLPSFHAAISPSSEKPIASGVQPSQKSNNRARNESKKLLAHLLGQLQSRPMPPSIFDAFKAHDEGVGDKSFGAIVETVRGAVKLKSGRKEAKVYSQNLLGGDDDEDDEDDREHIFTTNATYDLMMQLKEVLVISVAQGWHIFHDDSPIQRKKNHRESTGKSTSPFRRSRNSLQPVGGRSRSPSPAYRAQVQAPELLSQCISILSSVISEDCRFKISPPRPSRPPNALQALTLDVAQFLLHTHRHDPKVVSQIGFALIPAFGTFQPEMHVRLLTFFEEGVMRAVLDELRQLQGADELEFSTIHETDFDQGNGTHLTKPPVVSIQVDEAQEDSSIEHGTNSKWAPWTSSTQTFSLRSTNAPLQSLSVYYLASLTPPLLAAVLGCVDLVPRPNIRIEVLHRFYQLLDMIVGTKLDAYLDLLKVVAYHTAGARHSAVALLMSFWPRATGHIVISKPLYISSYLDTANIGMNLRWPKDHPYAHQFVPWRFYSQTPRLMFEGMPRNECRSCSSPIHGFGLMCPFCMCAVHFDCYDYPEGCHVTQYSLASDLDVQRVAMYRFSDVLPVRRHAEPHLTRRQQHVFRPVNLFTLCLCVICRKPLWGCTMQGLKCTSCFQFVHSSCLSSEPATDLLRCNSSRINSNHMTIDWSILRLSCLEYYGEILSLTREELGQRNYEEVSIFFAILWTQMQLMVNGVAMGSIVVIQNGKNAAHAKEYRVDTFELHHAVEWCEAYLLSHTLPLSLAMEEYLQENRFSHTEHCMLFDWSNLVYISSALKSPHSIQKPTLSASSDLLNVSMPDALAGRTTDTCDHPFEVVSLPHMRDVLGYEFQVHSDTAARLILSYLHHLGFFDRVDSNPNLFDGGPHLQLIYCNFPLPLGLDLSTDVETLVSSVEACLSDLDLSVNEFGFLLLVRKLWPNGMVSEYALRRLTRYILSWILAEDDNLATILRDYLAKQQVLPGVRSALDPLPWPSAQSSRPTPTSSVNNGGDYVASRRALLSRYAVRWLLALHDQDPAIYAIVLYDIAVEITENGKFGDDVSTMQSDEERKKRGAEHYDTILRCITRLAQTSITFSVFDDIFLRWLDSVSASSSNLFEEPMPSLYRLFPREVEASQRFSTILETTPSQTDGIGSFVIDPWRVVTAVASESREGLARSLRWLCIFACSGVDIPNATFMQFSSLATQFNSSLADSLLLVRAAMSSAWLKSIGRHDLQVMFSALHSRLALHVLDCLKKKNNMSDILCFIRQSLATCLLLYGCDRNVIVSLKMISEDEIRRLPSRKKLNARGQIVSDPIIIDVGLMDAIERYINANMDGVSCLVAKFLNTFVMDSPFLEPYEVDNFILRNGRILCACAWQFYDIQRHDISSIRTSFLLRTLVVDSQPLQTLLRDWFQPTTDWELRLLAATRLFRIILDVTSPAFVVEGRQWRSSVIDVFYHYFSAMWTDEKEEVRLAVDTWSQTLLPAHFEAISLCWNESLAKAPISERVKLISFLIQLHPHFPDWRVLSWEVIIETLLEDDYEQKNRDNEDGPAAAHLSMYGLSSKDEPQARTTNTDPDMAMLRVSILLLSLQMIADGIAVDTFTLLKIKLPLVQVIGFSDVSVIPSASGHAFHVHFGEVREIPDLAFPCIAELLSVLDAHYPLDLAPSAMGVSHADDGTVASSLVGTIFVDVSIGMFCTAQDLSTLPVLTVKSMLEGLGIVIYKHDFESKPLRYLQQQLRRAVSRVLELLLQDVSYELRQLALSVTQAFIKRWHSFMGSILFASIDTVAKLIASQSHHSQDILVAQARSFIESTLITYSNGILINLCKRPLDRDFFVVLKHITDGNAKTVPHSSESLRDALLRDTFSRAVENDYNTFQIVINNLQTYIEIVHHQGYSADLMQFVGQHLTHLARRTSEWAADAIDPAPLLLIPAVLIQHNKMHSRELLLYTDTVLRVALNRLNVKTASLSRLLHVTSTLFRKSQPQSAAAAGQIQPNSIVQIIFEILGDGLRMKARVLPLTLASMLEAIMTTDTPGTQTLATIHINSFLGLVDNGLHFLQNHPWSDMHSGNDLTVSLAVAKMVLEAATYDRNIMIRLSEQAEKSSRQSLGVHAWNFMTLAVLMDPSEAWVAMLFAQLSTFSLAHNTALRVYLQSGNTLPESATSDINHAYIAIKLWLLLAQKKSAKGDIGNMAALMVWNELWPAFESLMNLFEVEAQTGYSSTLATLTWSSVADIFIFVHCLHCPIALEVSSQIATLNRLRRLGRGESSTGKLTRALRSMTEPPPEVPFDVLVSQTAKDIVAAEKLRVLEAKGEIPDRRGVPERHRRDARVPT